MVPQRVFQKLRRIGVVLILAAGASCAWASTSSVAQAQDAPTARAPAVDESARDEFQVFDASVIDLRSGSDEVRSPSREAFTDALGEHGELRLSGDLELRKALAGSQYSAILEQGKANLAVAALAYGSHDCAGARSRSSEAILDLAAAHASGAQARRHLRSAYLYRFLCAHREQRADQALAAARILRRLADADAGPDGRPTEISTATWQQYPTPDVQSNGELIQVSIESSPPGADIMVDFEQRGISPNRIFLSPGEHLVAMGGENGTVSQRITVSAAGTVKLALHPSRRQWIGITDSLDELRAARGDAREKAMLALMAAVEAQVAFVMREPGRVSVWILPTGKHTAQHVGHAPNASIAGEVALQALQESSRSPGLNPMMPLLTEDHTTTTRSSSNRRWWVYGVVLGAAAIGAGFMVAQDLSENRQRIEVSLP
ncbi:MAG: PEGA domain-containing protein [Myxococcales bacterium]|nr:PEGA domain-containing protein [Myxococcales bacterium]